MYGCACMTIDVGLRHAISYNSYKAFLFCYVTVTTIACSSNDVYCTDISEALGSQIIQLTDCFAKTSHVWDCHMLSTLLISMICLMVVADHSVRFCYHHHHLTGHCYVLTGPPDCAAKDASQAELTVLTDRAQGGTSLASGEMEVMLHRRTLFDDQRGVAEPLNETMQGCMNCPSAGLIARGRHWLILQVPPCSLSHHDVRCICTFCALYLQ